MFEARPPVPPISSSVILVGVCIGGTNLWKKSYVHFTVRELDPGETPQDSWAFY